MRLRSQHPSRVYQKCLAACNKRAEHAKHVQNVHRFWILSCKQAIEAAALPVATSGWSMPLEASLVPQGDLCRLQPLFAEELITKGFPYGDIFCARFCTWWNALTWIQQSDPISILELYCDFSLRSKSTAPVRTSKKPLRWGLRDMSVKADLAPKSLGHQLRIWGMVLKWVQLVAPDSFPSAWIPRCTSMHVMGYKRQFAGLHCRPQLLYSSFEALWKYPRPASGNLHQLTHIWPPAVERSAAFGGA